MYPILQAASHISLSGNAVEKLQGVDREFLAEQEAAAEAEPSDSEEGLKGRALVGRKSTKTPVAKKADSTKAQQKKPAAKKAATAKTRGKSAGGSKSKAGEAKSVDSATVPLSAESFLPPAVVGMAASGLGMSLEEAMTEEGSAKIQQWLLKAAETMASSSPTPSATSSQPMPAPPHTPSATPSQLAPIATPSQPVPAPAPSSAPAPAPSQSVPAPSAVPAFAPAPSLAPAPAPTHPESQTQTETQPEAHAHFTLKYRLELHAFH